MRRRYARFAMTPHSLLDTCHDARAFHLYAWLDRMSDRQGSMRRPLEDLAASLRTSPRSVKRALASLRLCGAVEVQRERRADGTLGRSSIVLLHRAAGGLLVQRATNGLQVQSATGGLVVPFQGATGGPACGPSVAPHKEIQIKDLPEKNIQAGAAESASPIYPVERRTQSAPTEAQIWAFLKGLWQNEAFATIADFNDAARFHASRLRGFDWDADVMLFNTTFNKFLSAVDAGRVRRA